MRSRSASLVVVILVLAAAAAAGCEHRTASKPAPRPKQFSASAYLDHALTLIRTHEIYRPPGGWAAFERSARNLAAGAKTPSDTYLGLRSAVITLFQAGDLHASFADAATARAQAHGSSQTGRSKPPTVSLAAHRVGVIVVPAIASAPDSTDARRYEANALARVLALQRSGQPCAWVVDLRGNWGGDMWPMLLSLGPIVGSGRLIGFTNGRRPAAYVSYRDGALSLGKDVDRAPRRTRDFVPAPAVAVLTDSQTASSGEAVAIAFRGRPQTRSFGFPTAGAPNSPESYRLSDGAVIRISTSWDVDRNGHVYRRSLTPDAAATSSDPSAQAVRWLLSTPTCKHER